MANPITDAKIREVIAEHEAEAAACQLPQVRERHLRSAESWRRALRQSEAVETFRGERLKQLQERGDPLV